MRGLTGWRRSWRRRRGNREDIRTQVEREAEAGVKLQMQQQDFEWRQKYQVIIT